MSATAKRGEPVHKSMWPSFIAGGAAGAASRTIVSPLERLKVIMYVYTAATDQASST